MAIPGYHQQQYADVEAVSVAAASAVQSRRESITESITESMAAMFLPRHLGSLNVGEARAHHLGVGIALQWRLLQSDLKRAGAKTFVTCLYSGQRRPTL